MCLIKLGERVCSRIQFTVEFFSSRSVRNFYLFREAIEGRADAFNESIVPSLLINKISDRFRIINSPRLLNIGKNLSLKNLCCHEYQHFQRFFSKNFEPNIGRGKNQRGRAKLKKTWQESGKCSHVLIKGKRRCERIAWSVAFFDGSPWRSNLANNF